MLEIVPTIAYLLSSNDSDTARHKLLTFNMLNFN